MLACLNEFCFSVRPAAMRAIVGISLIAVQLAAAAFAQTPARQQREVIPPASQTAPWFQPPPARRVSSQDRPIPAALPISIQPP